MALTQSQIAGREIPSQVPGFLCIAVTDDQVVVPDRKRADRGFFGGGHGKLAHGGTGSIGADEDRALNDRTIAEGGNHALAAFVEGNVDKRFAVLDLISGASECSVWSVGCRRPT